MPASNEETSNSAQNIGAALFTGNCSETFAEQFKDKVRAIHEHFDQDKDGHLNYKELSSLQLCTSGNPMEEEVYLMVCRGLGCHPSKGLALDHLKLTYATEGTNLEEDYEKVFGEQKGSKAVEDGVIEVGEGGVDISPDK